MRRSGVTIFDFGSGVRFTISDEPIPTYAAVYGEENPWVQWLGRHAPRLLHLTPSELRRYMKGDSWQGPKDWNRRAAA